MGSGKSFWGRRLAERMDMPMIDLDTLIEQEEERSIPEIFATSGEAYFRRWEASYLRQTADIPRLILSTGGGTPCFSGNMDWMNATGLTIYLKVSAEDLFERLSRGRAGRPLIKDLNDRELRVFIEQKLAEREPFYQQARLVVPQDRTGNYQEKLLRAIEVS